MTIVGYTDFPSRMASQSSQLYATNVRHLLTELTPEKDGEINVNMEDEVIRSATVVKDGEDHVAAAPGEAVRGAEERNPSRWRLRWSRNRPKTSGLDHRWRAWPWPGLAILGVGSVAPNQFHEPLHRLRSGLFCWLAGHLECHTRHCTRR